MALAVVFLGYQLLESFVLLKDAQPATSGDTAWQHQFALD